MKNKCIHRYLKNCKVNPQPPGFADFLTGSITLFILSKRHGFDFFIDWSSHPIFKNFEYDDSVFVKMDDVETIELIPPYSPNHNNHSYENLLGLFNKKEDFYVFTNFDRLIHFENTLGFTDEEKKSAFEYIRKILSLEKTKSVEFDAVKKRADIVDKKYTAIHLRFHDVCLTDPNFAISQDMVNKILNFISNLERAEENIAILSNWQPFINFIKRFKPNLISFDSKPIHTGDLDRHLSFTNSVLVDEKLRDTIFDLKILSESKKIYAISQYGMTGFSNITSKIYNVDFEFLPDISYTDNN
jgi:hypothetical protein